MLNLSQNDPRWSWKKLGFSNLTIGHAGCAVDCVGIMTSLNPDYVNDQLKAINGFVGAAIIWAKAAKMWNIKWDARQDKAAFYPTVACTDHYRYQGYPTHFFVLLANGQIVDPLDGRTKNNPYRIISYRNIGGKS